MIGETILHYRIVEKLGEGGMGEVWKAQDTRLDRFVALKFLPEKTARDPEMVERFLREARAASALNHPGICTIHDIGEWEGRRYIVMELMEGETLGEKASQGALGIEIIVETGIQLSQALEAAHGKNIIHRDIKSTNIILTEGGQTKILDFGLAKIVMPSGRPDDAGPTERTIEVAKDITDAGQAVGTVSYMSPEQALGKDVDSRTDIFSMGVVLYEMATGRRAFPGSTPAAIFDAILNKSPVAPVSINRKLPAELGRIINKALEKDRDLRYQSAAEIATDLKRLQRDTSSPVAGATTTTTSTGTGRWIGIAVVIAVVAGVWYFGFRDRSARPVGPLTTRQLTSYVGLECCGTWSPDGNFFAYTRSASGLLDIFVQPLEGGDPVHLVRSPADDIDPRWSPNNKWIAFTSNTEGTWGIYLTPPLGGDVRRLADTGVPGGLIGNTFVIGSYPWSPDAQLFLFARRDSSGLKSIWKIEVETGIETRLTFPPKTTWDGLPSWSPDGSSIVFSRVSDAGTALIVMSPNGEGLREVLADGNNNHHASWFPDSKSLLFSSDAGGSQGIWMLRIGSKKPMQLTSGAGTTLQPTVSRNGQILYGTFSYQNDLYIQNLGSSEERRLTTHTEDNFLLGRFSPDGKVLYESSRTGNYELFVLDLESGEEQQLTDHQDYDGHGDWSPDGREIVFVSTRPAGEIDDGGRRLWTMPAEGGIPQLLHEKTVALSRPVFWSPEGSLIGFVSLDEGGHSFWVLNREDGSLRKVLDHVDWFGWYRDERRVIVTTDEPDGFGKMRAVDLETGKYSVLHEDPHSELIVAPDGSAVSYCSAISHTSMNLHVLKLVEGADGLPRPGGEPEQITRGKGEWHVHNGDWSPDGRQLVYTRITNGGNLYLLEGAFGGAN